MKALVCLSDFFRGKDILRAFLTWRSLDRYWWLLLDTWSYWWRNEVKLGNHRWHEAVFYGGLRLLPRSAWMKLRRQLKEVRPTAGVEEGYTTKPNESLLL